MAREVTKKIAATTAQGGRRRAFRANFGSLAGSIKTIHELEFVTEIASFQLAHKSSNLMMFRLPRIPQKL